MASRKLTAQQLQDKQAKADAASIKRCAPCRKCKCKPVWGAYFLVCPKCGQETDYDDPKGNSVREWNRNNRRRVHGT